jgi:hypothetical protein
VKLARKIQSPTTGILRQSRIIELLLVRLLESFQWLGFVHLVFLISPMLPLLFERFHRLLSSSLARLYPPFLFRLV